MPSVPSMRRRDVLQLLGSAGLGVLARRRDASSQPAVPFSVQGSGPVIIAFDRDKGFYDQLTDRYRVVVMDYPPPVLREATSPAVIQAFTPDRVCADILSVADAVGADRFAYYGFSWGGVVGLQLAIRTDRLSALICGGWPPLGAPYPLMEAAAPQPLYKAFYRHLTDWPEREAVSTITCPRLTFAGRDDIIDAPGVTARIGPLIAEHQIELEQMGWRVRLVDGFKHELGFRPDVVMPLLREFLDPLFARA